MRHTMIRSAAMSAAALAVAWVTLTDTPDLAAQGRGRGAGAAPAAAPASKPAPVRDLSGVWMKGRAPQVELLQGRINVSQEF